MSLSVRTRRLVTVLCALAGAAAGVLAHGGAGADGVFTTTHTFFQEYGGPLRMTVYTPGVGARVDAGEHLTISASWDADILTGASVRTVDAPSSGADITSTATVTDFRNQAHGGVTLKDELGSLRLGYTYGTENDYRSHAFDATARTELFQRDTALEVSYARGFDSVCDVDQTQGGAHPIPDPVLRRALPSSEHCFSGMPDRVTHDVSLQSFQGSWTQAWLPVLVTQTTLSAQLVDGFQSNPYRSIWLGRTAAQEHQPDFRARYAVGVSGRLFIEPLKGTLALLARGYMDTWGIKSITGEVAWEQSIAAGLSLRVRGRYYAQSAAAFFSDDYAHMPRGQFFTGDRELSEMHSVTLGARFGWEIPPGGDGKVLGFMQTLTLVLKGDYLMFDFPGFHYGAVPVPNTSAIVATFGLEAVL